jgi:hypothetical protein
LIGSDSNTESIIAQISSQESTFLVKEEFCEKALAALYENRLFM